MVDESSTRRGVLLGAGLLASAHAAAGAAVQGGPSPAARINAGAVGVISGGIEGTYIRIAADLAAVLDDGDRLRVLPIVGKGSVQNISDLIYLRGVDVGIVQSDVLAFAARERMFPGVGSAVTYIAKLYDEEIHILVRPEIRTMADLAGKRVNVDDRGSGTAMTASLVFSQLQIPIQPTHQGQQDALQQLRTGEISALVYVTGKPAALFTALDSSTGLHFLPLPQTAELLDTYLPAQLSPASYPNLLAQGEPVSTLAVGAVMAAYAWKPDSERHEKVARFVAALRTNFSQLQKPPRHPKWRDVNLAARLPGWRQFSEHS